MKEHFDPTLPRNRDLHRIKLINRKKCAELVQIILDDEKRKHDRAVEIVEKLFPSYEDRPLGS